MAFPAFDSIRDGRRTEAKVGNGRVEGESERNSPDFPAISRCSFFTNYLPSFHVGTSGSRKQEGKHLFSLSPLTLQRSRSHFNAKYWYAKARYTKYKARNRQTTADKATPPHRRTSREQGPHDAPKTINTCPEALTDAVPANTDCHIQGCSGFTAIFAPGPKTDASCLVADPDAPPG